MKFKVKWTASYETVIEADSLESAQAEAASMEVDVPGSRYIEDSWEVLGMAQTSAPD